MSTGTSRDDDDLDRVFGPDTSTVPTRTTSERVRRWTIVGASVVAVTVVTAVVLGVILDRVQGGIGGVFPEPDRAATAMQDRLDAMPDIRSAQRSDPVKTSFAGYDVTATVVAEPGLDAGAREQLVDGIAAAAAESAGNGVHVYAVADFGDLTVGVSGSERMSDERLTVAEDLRSIGGVTGVRCVWVDQDAGVSDDAAGQRITVETPGTGIALDAIRAEATKRAERVFPGATIVTAPPRG